MKKNISINISGIIFHIEEDGYEILRKYLDSINRYFSSFEDNSEILADIESRIAEILLSKLSEGKQVVTADDVNALMATMGSVNDFKAAEEQEVGGSTTGAEQEKQRQQSGASQEPIASKKLFRDGRKKILGGVCSGLAHYFNIDPVWPRLIFALLAFPTYGGLVLAYIILWIIIPQSDTLEDETSSKKMYRDTDNRVIGGVASGLAAFWGLDSTVVRVLFIGMTIFGGLGILIYIIMWIALPEAKTITEKMQMSGEPVTLSNIESSVKRGLNEKDGAEESVFAKIILFPFRLLAMLIDALGRILGPVFLLIVDIFRIGIGLCFTLTGAALIFALIVSFGALLGWFTIPIRTEWNDWYIASPNFPLEIFRGTFPNWMVLFAFITAFVPAFMIALLGASIIAKKIVFNAYVGWALFVTFFIGAGVLAFTIPQMIYAFRVDGEYKVEQTYTVKGTPVFRINEVGLDDYNVTDLSIHGYDGKELKLVERFEAQGNNRKIAADNAQMVEYNVTQSDSILTFDSNITFRKDAKFRAQRLDLDLYIPTNMPFIMEEGMWQLINNRWDDSYYYSDRNQTQTWRVNDYGVLECVSCENRYNSDRTNDRSDNSDIDVDDDDRVRDRVARDEFGFRNFDSIDLEGLFDVTIEKGDGFSVEVDGDNDDVRRYNIYTSGETLVVEYDDNRKGFWRGRAFEDHDIEMHITMPRLRNLEASGGGKVRFRGFEEDEVSIELTGAVQGNAGIDARSLTVKLTGASALDIAGTGNYLDADVTGASTLSAYGFEVRDADVEAHGASTVKVYVTDKLEISRGMASSVSHRGDPEIINDNH
jgi:phage shock protein PspC (stress-responsive transcriptional regulator)